MMDKQRQELRDAITEIKGIIQPLLDAKDDAEVDFPEEFTHYLTIDRIKRNAQSLDGLIAMGMPEHDQGIGLISRTILTDFITITYALHVAADRAEAFYCLYQSDHRVVKAHATFVSSLSDATSKIESTYLWNAAKRGSWQHRIATYFGGKTPKDFPKFGVIVDAIRAKKNEARRNVMWNEVLVAYEQWFYYSKYEHMGWVSFQTSRNIDEGMIAARIRIALYFAIRLLVHCLEAMNERAPLIAAEALRMRWMDRMEEPPLMRNPPG